SEADRDDSRYRLPLLLLLYAFIPGCQMMLPPSSTVNHGSLLGGHAGHVQHVHAALRDQRAFDGDVLIHVLDEHVLGGLMILHPGEDEDLAILLEKPDGVSGLGAGRGAGLVLWPVISPFV